MFEYQTVWSALSVNGLLMSEYLPDLNNAVKDFIKDKTNKPTIFANNTQFILQKAARDLANEKLHSYPLSNLKSSELSPPIYINTTDTINRNSTASVAVFHVVSEREKAHLATMWILLGQPVCTVAVPLWANSADVPPELTGPGTAALCDFSRALASYLYPDRRGHMNQYLSISRLLS